MSLEFDLIADYFPDTVSDSSVRAAYSRLQTWFAYKFPDLDTRPGSVFGDTFVLPAATYLASNEQGMSAFAADLDLENVAAGNIGRCDFVQMYLRNFGTTDNKDLRSTGLLRLVFSVDAGQDVNKAVIFTANGGDYQLKVFGDTQVKILPVGVARSTPNEYPLTQTSASRYFVDLPVESYSQTTIVASTRFTSSVTLDNISDIYAVGDFFIGAFTSSLPALARKTRETFHAASMGTKNGVIRTIKREFPDLLSVSPVIQGQPEMTRDCANQFGVSLPAADIFIKSPFYGSTVVQVVKVPYIDGQFFGEIDFIHQPLSVVSITVAGSSTALSHQILTRSKDEFLYPRLSSAYSDNARYWLSITGQGVETGTDDQGNVFQNFEITYTAEPYVGIVTRWMEAPDNRPLGTSFQVRAAVPFVLKAFNVRFRRDRGKKFDTTTARKEIYDYLTALSWPTTYTDAEIYDSMYYAGASQTQSILLDGSLRYSIAKSYVFDDSEDMNAILASATDIPEVVLLSSVQFNTTYTDTQDPEDNLFFAASDVNTGFVLTLNNINLIET